MTFDDPLVKLIGSATDAPPGQPLTSDLPALRNVVGVVQIENAPFSEKAKVRTEEKPVQKPKLRRTRPSRVVGRPMTADDPLSQMVGSVTDAPPTDSSKKYEYLADAVAPKAP